MKYNLSFELPYTLDAYSHVTLQEMLQKEIQSFLHEKKVEVHLSREDWV